MCGRLTVTLPSRAIRALFRSPERPKGRWPQWPGPDALIASALIAPAPEDPLDLRDSAAVNRVANDAPKLLERPTVDPQAPPALGATRPLGWLKAAARRG